MHPPSATSQIATSPRGVEPLLQQHWAWPITVSNRVSARVRDASLVGRLACSARRSACSEGRHRCRRPCRQRQRPGRKAAGPPRPRPQRRLGSGRDRQWTVPTRRAPCPAQGQPARLRRAGSRQPVGSVRSSCPILLPSIYRSLFWKDMTWSPATETEHPGETRVAATPGTVSQLRKLGYQVVRRSAGSLEARCYIWSSPAHAPGG